MTNDNGVKSKFGKFKNWLTEGETEGEELNSYDEYDHDEYETEEVEEHDFEYEQPEKVTQAQQVHKVKRNTHTQMKVVIVEPKIYDDAAIIADHLKAGKTVVVNLESLTQPTIRKSIFDFMNGSVYVLEGSIQRVSKAIFVLAPNSVDIDASVKKELESKAAFPWTTK